MVKECHERVNSLLKINVVLPKRVIGIDEQSLGTILFPHNSYDTGSGASVEFDKIETA